MGDQQSILEQFRDRPRRNYANAADPLEVEPGAVLVGYNFARRESNTVAIVCDGPLTLRDCNLVNVSLDPRWATEGCNTAQIRFETVEVPAETESAERAEKRAALAALLSDEERAAIEKALPASKAAVTEERVTFLARHPSELKEGK